MPTELERLTALTDITLQLAQVERLTRDKDGNNESVTTHSHMLALVVLEVAPRAAKDDLGIAWFNNDNFVKQCLAYALVHDLPEYKHGDIPTLRGLSLEDKKLKEQQEEEAAEEMYELLGTVESMVVAFSCMYEKQANSPQRLVHLLDKMMPKLVLIANDGNLDPALEMTVEELVNLHDVQQEKLRNEYPEFPSVHELFNLACRECERVYANRLIANNQKTLTACRDYDYSEDVSMMGPECFGGHDYFPVDEEF